MPKENVRRAVYAASLDPITNGHINVIRRMAPLYDELIVVVAVDTRKTYTFTPEERVEMARAAIEATLLPNVTVDVCIGHYVVKHADSLGARVIIRGLRDSNDLVAELALAHENRRICPGIETIFLPCALELQYVSSSLVKGHMGIDPEWLKQVEQLVPAAVAEKLNEKFVLRKARSHWEGLMHILGNPAGSESIFNNLVARYAEPHRAYHTLEHIVSMLDELTELTAMPYDVLSLAIWFHDAVYNPKSKSNEEYSSHLAGVVMKKWGVSDGIRELVEKLIMVTEHLIVPTGLPEMAMTDLDLAILGKPEKVFDAYEAGIRREYSWVTNSDFASGRSKILQLFLDRKFIYSTEYFRDKYESVARKNLERSIRKLNSP